MNIDAGKKKNVLFNNKFFAQHRSCSTFHFSFNLYLVTKMVYYLILKLLLRYKAKVLFVGLRVRSFLTVMLFFTSC